ncbi:MAG: BACON domain-containing protein [Bacteroidales bacterium]|nr:BACON domain-containing protein [Bacteroidales bacterium]
MKRFLILCILAVLTGCELLDSKDFIVVAPSTELSFESNAASTTLIVTSSGKWIAGELPEWISVDPMEGDSDDEITISVAENQTKDDRTASFSLICGIATAAITVTQYGAIESDYVDLGLEEPGTTMTYDRNSGTITVTYADTEPSVLENESAVVLGAEYEYDIRVVQSSSVSGKTLTLRTSEGNMSDLFRNTSFTLVTSGAAEPGCRQRMKSSTLLLVVRGRQVISTV